MHNHTKPTRCCLKDANICKSRRFAGIALILITNALEMIVCSVTLQGERKTRTQLQAVALVTTVRAVITSPPPPFPPEAARRQRDRVCFSERLITRMRRSLKGTDLYRRHPLHPQQPRASSLYRFIYLISLQPASQTRYMKGNFAPDFVRQVLSPSQGRVSWLPDQCKQLSLVSSSYT